MHSKMLPTTPNKLVWKLLQNMQFHAPTGLLFSQHNKFIHSHKLSVHTLCHKKEKILAVPLVTNVRFKLGLVGVPAQKKLTVEEITHI